MRNTETYFEQVPIELVEGILQHDAALEKIPEKAPVPVPATERRAVKEFPKPKKNTSFKGQQ
jgi:hypothetical protein